MGGRPSGDRFASPGAKKRAGVLALLDHWMPIISAKRGGCGYFVPGAGILPRLGPRTGPHGLARVTGIVAPSHK